MSLLNHLFARHGDDAADMADMSGMSGMPAMDMSSSAGTSSSTLTGAATTSSSMNMGDMPGMTGSSGSSGMAGMGGMGTMMAAVFQTSINTPLYSLTWTPQTGAAYAGTCIFLILLAVLMRGMVALKARQEARWLDAEMNRRYIVVNGRQNMAERLSHDSLRKTMTLSENGVEENVMVVQKKTSISRPWRFTVDPIRALIDTVIAGVGYLLMLAVMTMNVGYFASVLGGTYLGSLAVGRFASSEH